MAACAICCEPKGWTAGFLASPGGPRWRTRCQGWPTMPEPSIKPQAWRRQARAGVGRPASFVVPVCGLGPRTVARLFGLALLLPVMACGSIGPGSVPRDRTDYIGAVAESWKEQTLLNVVRLRYGDAPTFLDVSSVISAYTFQGQLSAAGQVSS